MTNVLRISKKAFTWSVVVLTILWSVGLNLLVPSMAGAAAPNLQAGDLIRVSGDPTRAVYLIGSDMKRYYFPSQAVYNTWYRDFSGVQIIESQYVDAYPLGGGINPRPGSCYLTKTLVSPSVFAILPGNKKAKLNSPEIATALYGADWVKCLTKPWADVFDANLTVADPITEAKFHDGQLIQLSGSADVYHVKGGQLHKVDGALPEVARTDVRVVSSLSGYTMSNMTVTGSSVASNPTQRDGVTPPVGGSVAVSLAQNTPPLGYIAKGAYNAEFTKVTVRAVGGAVRVDRIMVRNDGLNDNQDEITTVRLYDGPTQLSSDQSFNNTTRVATFSNLRWEIPAGGTKTLTITGDTNASAGGTNVYMTVTGVELTGGGTVSGLPVSGHPQQYHAVSVGQLNVDAQSTPGATTLISGATAQELACFKFSANSTESFNLKSFTITNNGTISSNELSNFVVKDGATVLATVPGTFNSNNQVTFDFTNSPIFIEKSKNKTLCISADIASGITTSKTIILQIEEYQDVMATGDSSKSQVVVTYSSGTAFAAQSSQTMTVGQGTLTVARNTATLPVSTSLIDGVPHNKLAAFRFSGGSTEAVRVTRLRFTASGTGVSSADLSNFELYKYDEATGAETLLGTASMSGSNITFEDTNVGLFDVPASRNVVVHLYADVSTGADWTGTTLNAFLGSSATNQIIKAKGIVSNADIDASDITFSSVDSQHSNVVLFGNSGNGTLAVSLDSASPNPTSIAKGSNDVNFAQYRLTAGGEDVDVTKVVVRAYNTSGTGSTASTTNEFTNVRLYDVTNPSSPQQLGQAVQTPSSGASTFNFSLRVPKDNYKVLRVVADVPTNSSGAGYLHFDLLAATNADDMTSEGASSDASITETGDVTGRLMTISTPTLTVSWASGVTHNVVTTAADQVLGVLQLTAGQYEDVIVSTISIAADDASPVAGASSADTDLTLFRLSNEDGSVSYGSTNKNLTSGTPDTVLFEGIQTLTVPKGQTKSVYVRATIAGSSGTYYVGTDATSDVVARGAVSGSAATVSGTGTGRANTIQSVATLSFNLSTPESRVVGVGASGTGEEVTMLSFSADAQYEDVDITKLVFQVVGATGDSAQNSFVDEGAKLYKKVGSGSEVLVGSASIVSSTDSVLSTNYTATFVMDRPVNGVGGLRIRSTEDTTLIVKGILRGTENGLTSATSPVFRIGSGTNADDSLFIEARGASSGTSLDDGQFNSSNGVSLTGNQVAAYRSHPIFTYVSPGTSLVNGEQDVFAFKAKANNSGPISLKQLKFTVDIVDNVGTYNGSMALHSFKLYRGSTNITDQVKIQTNLGASLEGGSNAFATATGTGKTVYVTWTGTNEERIEAGVENTYYLKATAAGFTTPADDDYIRVRLDNDDASTELTQSAATYYLSPWQGASSALVDLLALDDSSLDTSLASTSTTSMIWSDLSAAGHTAATGTYNGGTASSSGDWFNGYLIKETPTSYSQLIN